MNRGYLYHDTSRNVGVGIARQKSLVPSEIAKPVLERKTDAEKYEEERKEEANVKTGYDVLVNDNGNDERDNYEEDESVAKRQEIVDAISLATAMNDSDVVSQLNALLERFDEEQDARLKEYEGFQEKSERKEVQDNPPIESRTVKELVTDFEKLENTEAHVKQTVFANVTSKLTSTFQKNMEKLGSARIVNDPIEMHEFAKLVNASYQFFEHRDFEKTREYMSASENAYIPQFNQWQVDETYSTPDNMVFVKYGRDLNNPTVVIACRGTANVEDWVTNVNMVLGGTEQVERFKDLETTLHRLKAHFPTSDIQVTGHSQGGGLSYALAQKYNLKGHHFDPAVFPTFRNNVLKQTARTWGSSPLVQLTGNMMRHDTRSSRQTQNVYKNGVDPVSVMMSLMDSDKNVRLRTVDVRSNSNTGISNPHSLANYYVEGYDGDVSGGVPVMRGGNTRKILEPVLKRAIATQTVRKTGSVGSSIAVGLTVNDTYHALKQMEANPELSASEKRAKQWLRTGTNVADLALSAGVGASAESAAAALLTSLGVSGSVAIGAPLLMGAAAALVASEAIKWIGGSLESQSALLSRFIDPQLVDVADIPKRKRRKIGE